MILLHYGTEELFISPTPNPQQEMEEPSVLLDETLQVPQT